MKIIGKLLDPLTRKILKTNHGELKKVPDYILSLNVYICANVLFQGIADAVLEIGILTDVFPYLPIRIPFLFLTAISVLIGYRTLQGMIKKKFDVTRNSIELSILIEIGLVVSDVYFIRGYIETYPHVLIARLPFVIITSFNILILFYTYKKLNLRPWWEDR